ncbi:NAD(P)-dependent oxidoreductase [Leptolyngbya sp. GB1-A1]|uniref:NAD(P)-dependent oxidoreductase n=1 Tax=Leptolyngbya sp. GB1-A1 TaxID=2933908 RepID=UPI0032977D2E
MLLKSTRERRRAQRMKIGLVGTGLMGLPMVERLRTAGEFVTAWNRTASKLQPLKDAGAELASSAAELLRSSELILLMLTDAPAIHEVLLVEECRSLLADRTVIQMGTIAPQESRDLHDEIRRSGGFYLEAPVLGSIPEAKAGTLQVMVGSTPEQFEQWSPILRQLGMPRYVGEVGSAAALKLALNQLIAALTTAFSLSLGFVQRQNVPIDTFMQVLRQSALYAPTFDKKLQRMIDRDFANPNFPTRHLLKDANLFLQEARNLGLQVDSLAGIQHIIEIACTEGLADADYSALFAAVNPEAGNPEAGNPECS